MTALLLTNNDCRLLSRRRLTAAPEVPEETIIRRNLPEDTTVTTVLREGLTDLRHEVTTPRREGEWKRFPGDTIHPSEGWKALSEATTGRSRVSRARTMTCSRRAPSLLLLPPTAARGGLCPAIAP